MPTLSSPDLENFIATGYLLPDNGLNIAGGDGAPVAEN